MSAVRWRAQAATGSAALIADESLGKLVLHASYLRESARVPLTDDDLRELRAAIDAHLRERPAELDDDDADVW